MLGDATRIVLIGASCGGTLAYEMTHNLTTPCDVIAIDSGTEFEKLNGNTFEEHQKVTCVGLRLETKRDRSATEDFRV